MADLSSQEAEALPLQVKLNNRRGRAAVPTFRRLRTRHQRGAGAKVGGPVKGHAAAATRSRNALGYRRVVVKARVVKMQNYGRKAAALHLRYLDREGTGLTAEREGFFDRDQTGMEREALTVVREGEPHQFRFIVSPQDGTRLDLTVHTRSLMQQVEKDLHRTLDWVAINHYNTDNPHTHIVVHGLDQKGEAVFIDREYIARGIRHRSEVLVTQELGLQTTPELQQQLQQRVQVRQLTAPDWQLVRGADEQGRFTLPPLTTDKVLNRLRHSQQLGRLAMLESWGLAERKGAQQWQLATDLPQQLRQMAQQEQGLQRLQRSARRLEPAPQLLLVHDRASLREQAPVAGLVVQHGFHDELSDKGYLVVGDVQGKLHYLEVDNMHRLNARKGHLVQVDVSIDIPGERKVAQQQKALGSPAYSADAVLPARAIRLQHALPMDQQIRYPGRTWFDQHFHVLKVAPAHHSVARQLQQATQQRSQWLQEQGLEPGTQASRLALDQRERQQAGQRLQQQTGLVFEPLQRGDVFRGELLQVMRLPSARSYAVVSDGKAFAMVPWQKERRRERSLQPGMSMAIGINQQGRAWYREWGRELSL